MGFRPNRMVNLRSFSIFALCLLLEVFPELYFIIEQFHDVQAVFMCLHEFVSLLVFVLKMFIFFFNRHRLDSLITDLRNEWRNCESLKLLRSFYKVVIFRKAFREQNSRWNEIGSKLEEFNFKTTRNLFAALFIAGFCYFTIPIFVFFLLFNESESKPFPLPVQV